MNGHDHKFNYKALPYFENLATCRLAKFIETGLVINHRINRRTLKHMELWRCPLNAQTVHAFIGCDNLEYLELYRFADSTDFASIHNDHDVQRVFADPISNKLKNLKYFKTTAAACELVSFFHWISNKKQCKTSFVFDTYDDCVYLENPKEILCALQTIDNRNSLNIELNSFLITDPIESSFILYRDNDFKFNHFRMDLNFSKFEIMPHSLVLYLLSHCKSSELLMKMNENDHDIDHLQNRILAASKSFDEISVEVDLRYLNGTIEQWARIQDGEEIVENTLTAFADDYVAEALKECSKWQSRSLWFTTRRMQQKGIKRIQFDLVINPKFKVLDVITYENALVARRKQEWIRVGYPVILKSIRERLSDLFTLTEECDVLHVRFVKDITAGMTVF